MELDAIAPNVREDLSGNQDGDERVLEGDPSTQKCETDDHRDESDADTAQELSDERRLERDANRTNCDGVFGVRYRRDLIGTVLNGAQGAKFGRVVQQLELAALQNRPALLVVKRGRLTSLAGSSIERYGDEQQRNRDQRRQPTASPEQHREAREGDSRARLEQVEHRSI